jgi:hypothetical protein
LKSDYFSYCLVRCFLFWLWCLYRSCQYFFNVLFSVVVCFLSATITTILLFCVTKHLFFAVQTFLFYPHVTDFCYTFVTFACKCKENVLSLYCLMIKHHLKTPSSFHIRWGFFVYWFFGCFLCLLFNVCIIRHHHQKCIFR